MEKSLLILTLISLILLLCACGATEKTDKQSKITDQSPKVTEERKTQDSKKPVSTDQSKSTATETPQPAETDTPKPATDTPKPKTPDVPKSEDRPSSSGHNYELPEDEL